MKTHKRIPAFLLALLLILSLLFVPAENRTVNAAANTLTVSSKKEVNLNCSIQIKTNIAATFKSSNKKIATVSKKGVVKGKKPGTAKITITSKTNTKDKKVITIKVKKNLVILSPSKRTKTLAIGKTITIKTNLKSTYKSSNKKVATVSKSGKVTAKGAGTAKITVTSKSYKSLKKTVSITVKQPDSNANENTTQQPTSETPTTEKPTTESTLTAALVYSAIIAKKAAYPEGTKWTNDNFYAWKGGIYSGGYGCAGFAFMLSDAAFGKLPAKKLTSFSNIRVGDILRVDNDNHSVIVLEVKSSSVIVAEGNYNSSVHWGREIKLSEIKATGSYVLTRYPD